MRGLYAIADLATLAARRVDPVAFAQAVLRAHPAALQLRAKDAPPRETLALLRELAPLCRRAGVPLIANDRPDLAVLAGCDLVHVGQTDMPIERVRRIAPGLAAGISTHTLSELEAALATQPSYVAFGPVFETTSKKDPQPVVGIDRLREAYTLARSAGVPLVAIGGITCERARPIVDLADAVAVIGGLWPPTVDGDAPAPAQGALRRLPGASDVLREVTSRAHAIQELFGPSAGLDRGRAVIG